MGVKKAEVTEEGRHETHHLMYPFVFLKHNGSRRIKGNSCEKPKIADQPERCCCNRTRES